VACIDTRICACSCNVNVVSFYPGERAIDRHTEGSWTVRVTRSFVGIQLFLQKLTASSERVGGLCRYSNRYAC
jgi:hypothetical protein